MIHEHTDKMNKTPVLFILFTKFAPFMIQAQPQ